MGSERLGSFHKVLSFEEILELFKWFIEHRKEVEEFMSQVKFTLSLTVTGGTGSTLTVTPSSGSASFTVGTFASEILGAVTGGVAPYTASVDASSPNQLPSGLSLSIDSNNNLVISGTATVGGSGSVLIDVNDSAGNAIASVMAKTTIR